MKCVFAKTSEQNLPVEALEVLGVEGGGGGGGGRHAADVAQAHTVRGRLVRA